MAAIDKIYGSAAQRRELKRFIRALRLPGHVKRSFYRRFYPVGYSCLTCFYGWQDRLLYRHKALPGWVRSALEDQYNGPPH